MNQTQQPKFEIRIHHTFTASHALTLPDGSLEPRHSHDWKVHLSVGADALDTMETVMDFHELEAMVQAITAPWQDTQLESHEPFTQHNASAERVARHIAEQLAPQLPQRVRLVHVAITEAPGCIALYRG